MSWLIASLPSIPGWSRSTPNPEVANEEEEEEDLDIPPPFPMLNSAQRSSAPSKKTNMPPPPSFSLAPPSPPRQKDGDPPSDLNIAILPDATPLGDMAPPFSTTTKPNFGMQKGGEDKPGGLTAGVPVKKAAKGKGGKVPLGPGYSALDWARLTSSGKDLRGIGMGPVPIRVTMEELKKHRSRDDAWAAFNGKVYNITPYLPFHPGGADEIMRAAGRDGTKLFMLTHSWVNMEYMLQECMVGILVRG